MDRLNSTSAFDLESMASALEEARRAFEEDEVPIGALVVAWSEDRSSARILAKAHNRCEALLDPTAHAEILALREACARVGAGRLDRATLYSTIEPCAMCAGAILHARIERVVFGARDPKFGAAGSIVDLLTGGDPRLGRFNHRTAVEGGVREDECAALMRSFFKQKRVPSDPSTTNPW